MTATNHTLIRRTGHTLMVGGLALIAYCAFVLFEAHVFQGREARVLQTLLDSRPQHLETSPPSRIGDVATTLPGDEGDHSANAVSSNDGIDRGLLGRMEIPRLGLSAVIVEGADSAALRHAIGHIPGTAIPGQLGNVAITGHRDTFFRPLRNI